MKIRETDIRVARRLKAIDVIDVLSPQPDPRNALVLVRTKCCNPDFFAVLPAAGNIED